MRSVRAVGCVLWLAVGLAGQQNPPGAPSASQQSGQNLPDNPEPQQQAPTFSKPAPAGPPGDEPQQPAAPSNRIQPATTPPERSSGVDSREQMFTLRTTVNQVFIPVTVKDENGHMTEGLLRRDFTVYEDGVAQDINFFTSDPFPLSAAVVLDVNISEGEMQKVNATMSALVGAFSEFDEVGLYTYGNTVRKELDYGAMTDRFASALRRVKPKGQTGGVPVTTGPMAGGPVVSGRPVDPSTPHVYTPPRQSDVLNDAILAAAKELGKRERARRKIIFVISDGMEYGSRAGYDEVRKLLLSSEIAVYGVQVDEGALPVYRQAQKIHLPRSGSSLLSRYAKDTGGEVYPELNRDAIEAAYARVTETARNQYTIGYRAKKTASGTYRNIEVVVHRGGLSVTAKPGYFPLPPGS